MLCYGNYHLTIITSFCQMYSKSSRLKSSSTSALIRCPKDAYEIRSRAKQQHNLKTTTSRSRPTLAGPTSHLTTVRDQNHDPYLLCRPAETGDALDCIQATRKKLRNLQFLESCLYSEIEKIQVNNVQPLLTTIESKYQQQVTDYDTVISNVDQLAIKISEGQQSVRQIKERQRMAVADIESQYLHRAEMLLQFEDCQQILTIYQDQFEEENRLVLRESELSLSLIEIEHNKRTIAAELEVIEAEQRQSEDEYECERNRYFEQKINQLRIDLLDQESAMNLLCSKHQIPTLRELICNYYSYMKDTAILKQEQEAIEVWLCRRELIEDFKLHIIERHQYTKSDISHAFKRFVDILNKMETIYKKMNSSKYQQSVDRRKAEQSNLMTQYNFWTVKEKPVKEELTAVKQAIQQLQAEEKLHKLQILEGGSSRQLALTLQRLSHQQSIRTRTISQTREHLKYLEERLRTKIPNPASTEAVQSLGVEIDKEEGIIRKLKAQYLRLDKARQQKQKEFRRVKNSRTPNKVHQDFEAVHILYKKINRIKQKKNELNSKISNCQNNTMSLKSPKAQTLTSVRLYSSRQMTAPCGGNSTSRSLFHKTHSEYHPIEETIQKLQRLKDSIAERTPMASVYSRVLKY